MFGLHRTNHQRTTRRRRIGFDLASHVSCPIAHVARCIANSTPLLRMVAVTLAMLAPVPFAIADVAGWSGTVSHDFNDQRNWGGNFVPGEDDIAIIYGTNHPDVDNSPARLSELALVGNIDLVGDGSLETNGQLLTVLDNVMLYRSNFVLGSPQLVIQRGALALDFNADVVTVRDGSLRMDGGVALIDNKLTTESTQVTTPRIHGHGQIILPSSDPEDGLVNDGVIFVTGGELLLRAVNGATLDLDGALNEGIVSVVANQGPARLVVDGPVPLGLPEGPQVFLGTFNVNGPNADVEFTHGWQTYQPSTLTFEAAGGGVNTISGPESGIFGNLTVKSSGNLFIPNTARFTSDFVSFFTTNVVVESGGVLQLEGETTYRGGSFTGGGQIKQVAAGRPAKHADRYAYRLQGLAQVFARKPRAA